MAVPVDEAPKPATADPDPQPQPIPKSDEASKKPAKQVDLYAVLEVSCIHTKNDFFQVPKDATAAQITKAYYRLAKKNHPDKVAVL